MANSYIGRQGLEECARKIRARSVLNPKTGCREWTGCVAKRKGKSDAGYGQIRMNGKMVKVHRVIYASENELDKLSAHVLHRCDNTLCTEGAHLFDGTNRDNIEDKIRKDRSGKKLNISKVRKIKAMLAQGVKQVDLAERFCVAQSIISRIKSGARWAHVQNNGGAAVMAVY